jgi:nitroreductase
MVDQPDTSHVDSLTSEELRDPSELHAVPAFVEMQTLGRVIRSRRTSMLVDKSLELPADLVQSFCDLAMWAPNHKRTWPWRFASVTKAGRSTLGNVIADAMAAHGDDEAKVRKARTKYERTPNVLVVGSAPGDSALRTAENRDAVAAGIQNVLLAATAAGVASYWGSCPKGANDPVAGLCGFEPGTHVSAIIYLGWASSTVEIPQRPRADVRAVNS